MGPNGVPLDTPAVNAAKAQHFNAVAEAKMRNGDHLMYAAGPIATTYAAATPVVASGIAVAALATPVYQGPIHLPVMGPNGVPLDTPEVNAAKINHFQDVAEAKLRNGDHLIHAAPIATYAAPISTYAAPISTYAAPILAKTVAVAAGPIHLPVMGPNGVPLDTPAVNAAKAQHFNAVAEAKVRNGDNFIHAAPLMAPIHSGHGHWMAKRSLAWAPQHLPVMGPNGVPLDTPAVNAAKAQHFNAVAEAKMRNGDHLMYAAGPIAATYAAATPVVASGIAVAALATPVYQGPIHLPVIGPNGVPLDTPEVNAAKINHFNDVAEAKMRNGDNFIHAAPFAAYAAAPVMTPAVAVAAPIVAAGPIHLPVMGPNGVPLDTPEVVNAKMAHFAAHARANQMAY